MNVVIWTALGQRFAVPTGHVEEVIPVVESRPLPGTAACVRGLINYRGKLIPLIDAAALLEGNPCLPKMTARILVIDISPADGAETVRFGLLVETLLGNEDVAFEDSSSYEGGALSQNEWLGPVARASTGTIQLLRTECVAEMVAE
jgi:chemotaxis signal transduction protein